jgi:hypothetical protein
MQIIMLDSIVMANGVLRCGAIYDLSEARALKMISKGLAKTIDSPNVERPTVKRRIVTSLLHGDKG